MKKFVALSLVLAGLLGTALPTLAATEGKQKPGKPKRIEKTRRHLHHESMHRVSKSQRERAKDGK